MKKQLKAILTNQDPWITDIISKELLITKYAFYIWNITTKFSSWFTSILHKQYLNTSLLCTFHMHNIHTFTLDFHFLRMFTFKSFYTHNIHTFTLDFHFLIMFTFNTFLRMFTFNRRHLACCNVSLIWCTLQ